MPHTGEVHILRESQHAVYRNEIARLHGLLDIKNAANQILRDAMTAQRADHAASEARIRRERFLDKYGDFLKNCRTLYDPALFHLIIIPYEYGIEWYRSRQNCTDDGRLIGLTTGGAAAIGRLSHVWHA